MCLKAWNNTRPAPPARPPARSPVAASQVKSSFPEEYAARELDKLRYRYPRGESYLDIIARLEPVIFEMERQKAPLLIIAHQVHAYLRVMLYDKLRYR